MGFITDIWHAIQMLVGSFDAITIGIAIVSAVAAGFIMVSLGQILTNTVIGLLLFAVLSYGKAVLVDGANASAHAEASWTQFLALPMLTFVAYAIVFAVAVAIVGAIRSAVLR